MSDIREKPRLELVRRIAAPPAAVFAAWTEPEKLAQWFGPNGAEVVSAEIDARAGGRFHVVFRTPDGESHDVSGTYREFIAASRLVFTWQWITMPERRSLVTVLLEKEGTGTSLTLRHEQFFDEAARDRHVFGWTGALDKLEAFLA
jgi:uncharacterized protein YndB with AHSA1/START domain